MPCKWHPLTAMENAVKGGFTYDADAVVMPVKCTGLVKVSYLLKLFAKGMRGVLVLGCDEGDCRYYNGSARCAEIVDETREILDLAGIERDRLQFHVVAESGGSEVKRILKGFFKQFGKGAAAARAVKAAKPKASRSQARRAKQPAATKRRKQTAGAGKPTVGTKPVKARKGTRRGSSRGHK